VSSSRCSELLLRGWNVAVPVVDVGDDVFVVDDNDKTTYRLQVKAAEPKQIEGGGLVASFLLSRRQLKQVLDIELFFMLLIRDGARWRFLVIPRPELAAIREKAEQNDGQSRPGRALVPDTLAKRDDLNVSIELSGGQATLWGQSLDRFVDQWPDQLPIIVNGPGKRS